MLSKFLNLFRVPELSKEIAFEEIFFDEGEDNKFSCEEWFLMDDLQRKEEKLPLENEYRWRVNPSNPDRVRVDDLSIGEGRLLRTSR